MKYFFILYVLSLAGSSFSQTLTLSYDASGNRIKKEIVNPIPKPIIVGDTSICARSTTVLRATNCSTYVWVPSGSTGDNLFIYGDTTRTYKVYGYNTVGCRDSASVKVAVRPVPFTGPISAIGATGYLNAIDTFRAPARDGSFYDWSVKGGSIIWGYGTPVIAVQWRSLGRGWVQEFEYVDSFRCTTDTAIRPVNITSRDRGDKLQGEEDRYLFSTFPNPSTGNVFVKFYETGCYQLDVAVVNTLGVTVYRTQMQGAGSYEFALDEQVFAVTGMYTILLHTEHRNLTQKIIVQK